MNEVTRKIKLNTPDDVKEFVNLASGCKGRGKLKSGWIETDVKSLLGIFECNLTKAIDLVCTPDIEAAVSKFIVA